MRNNPSREAGLSKMCVHECLTAEMKSVTKNWNMSSLTHLATIPQSLLFRFRISLIALVLHFFLFFVSYHMISNAFNFMALKMCICAVK